MNTRCPLIAVACLALAVTASVPAKAQSPTQAANPEPGRRPSDPRPVAPPASIPAYELTPAQGTPGEASAARPAVSAAYRPLTVEGARARIEQLEAELNSALELLKLTEESVRAGTATAADAVRAQTKISSLKSELSLEQSDLTRARRAQKLTEPVNVKLTQASIRQTAEAISQAAGMNVLVASSVPAEKRLTVEARGVSLGLLMETIANQAELMIYPAANGAVELRPWPVLDINGTKRELKPVSAPWSEEWRFAFSARAADGGPFYTFGALSPSAPGQFVNLPVAGQPDLGAPPAPLPINLAPSGGGPVENYGSGVPTMGSGFAPAPQILPYGTAAPLALTSLGERFVVVAEPGCASNGSPGAWLTVYRLDGTQLKRVGVTFHASPLGAAGAPSGQAPTAGMGTGMPGRGPRGGGYSVPPTSTHAPKFRGSVSPGSTPAAGSGSDFIKPTNAPTAPGPPETPPTPTTKSGTK